MTPILIVIGFLVIGALLALASGQTNCGEVGCITLCFGFIGVVLGFSALPRFHRARTVSRTSELRAGLEEFHRDCGRFPTPEEGLGALVQKPEDCESWKAYLDAGSVPEDGFGRAFIYTVDGEAESFEIRSTGLDPDDESDDIVVTGGAPDSVERR